MKVREFIEYLKTLNQDKDIWVSYDGDYKVWPPDGFCVAREDRSNWSDCQEEVTIKKGDYVFEACC